MAILPKLEQAELIRPNGRPLPDLIERQAQAYYVARGDVRLRVMLATAPTDDPRGTIIFCPGRTEFIEKYFESFINFMERGFSVLVLDLRGQGLSTRPLPDPLRFYVRDFQEYADDLSFVVDTFAPHLPKPHIAMGHSMGGCITLHAILSGVMNPSAVVCSAPMLGLIDIESFPATAFVRAATLLGFSKRNLPFQGERLGLPVPFKGNKLTSDKPRYDIWAEYFATTPEMRVGTPTFGWIQAGLRSMAYVNRNAAQLKIPGLIVGAGADPIIDPVSNERFADAAGIDYKVVPGALHELLIEQNRYRVQFFEAFDTFLEENAL